MTRYRLKAILGNSAWMGGERIVRSLTGFLVVVWMARALGPTQFGQLNFAHSILLSLMPIAMLGISGLLVKEIVQSPGRRDQLLSAALVLRGIALMLAFPVLVVVTWFVSSGDEQVLSLTLILSLILLSVLSDGVECVFLANMNNRALVQIKLSVFVMCTLFKVGLIYLNASVMWFAAVIALESLSMTIILGMLSRGRYCAFRFVWARQLFLQLLTNAWPLAVVALVASIYSRLDLILLGHFMPYSQVGVYAAAWKIVEALAFLPAIVVTAMAPVLADYYQQSSELFNKKLGFAFRWLFWGLLVVVVLSSVGAELFMTALFGEKYAAAIPVFEIMVWVLLPMLFNLFVTQSAINTGNLRFLAESSCVGLVVGLALGLMLIPQWGVTGAAISTLSSHVLAFIGYAWFRPSGRAASKFQRAIWGG